ncbi:tRNA methyltransferase complex GCD14 subunit protein [Besnoitia besnoiti]|uniref:tRNA (adenine(58)-N(1))-methyltransferase n=1 Tax=Besnoitia besnoiti TaxID=94643 RepID=A0A2A9M9G1_BESBE|nr:tRNA methyltransferase complex GCD14 subunit protein [Besnoitia besnoiti]PFH32546.1 tRNA methyltransferase complex GCD14 subunit protein [Besnoitia besnoiti]
MGNLRSERIPGALPAAPPLSFPACDMPVASDGGEKERELNWHAAKTSADSRLSAAAGVEPGSAMQAKEGFPGMPRAACKKLARHACPRYGDFVILYGSHEVVIPVVLQRGRVSNSRLGNYRHEDIVATPYGSKVKERKSKRWLVVMHPSPDLFSLALTHRTQILYHADISLILMLLDAHPGKRICEAGTGSGSLSCHLARAVGPTGRVFTFEFHQLRRTEAEAEFKRLGLSEYLKSFHRDVCAEGFVMAPEALSSGSASTRCGASGPAAAAGPTARSGERCRAGEAPRAASDAAETASGGESRDATREPELPTPGSIDGLFLDVPSPWLALEHVNTALREGGRFVNFSPCIEQVQRVCESLCGRGYQGIRTFEVLRKPWGVWTTKPTARHCSTRGDVYSELSNLVQNCPPQEKGDTSARAGGDTDAALPPETSTASPPGVSCPGSATERQAEGASSETPRDGSRKKRKTGGGQGCVGEGSDQEVHLATFPLLISQQLGQALPEEFASAEGQSHRGAPPESREGESGGCAGGGDHDDAQCAADAASRPSCDFGSCHKKVQRDRQSGVVPVDFEATHYPLPMRGHTGYLTVAVKPHAR